MRRETFTGTLIRAVILPAAILPALLFNAAPSSAATRIEPVTGIEYAIPDGLKAETTDGVTVVECTDEITLGFLSSPAHELLSTVTTTISEFEGQGVTLTPAGTEETTVEGMKAFHRKYRAKSGGAMSVYAVAAPANGFFLFICFGKDEAKVASHAADILKTVRKAEPGAKSAEAPSEAKGIGSHLKKPGGKYPERGQKSGENK